jgi:hypothetical protein
VTRADGVKKALPEATEAAEASPRAREVREPSLPSTGELRGPFFSFTKDEEVPCAEATTRLGAARREDCAAAHAEGLVTAANAIVHVVDVTRRAG